MESLMKPSVLLCRLGLHRYKKSPRIANLDTFWLQAGEECARCGARKISFEEASRLATFSYERGKERAENKYIAYGRAVGEVVRLYGKPYVQKMLDGMED